LAEFLYTRGFAALVEENSNQEQESGMSSTPRSPEKQAELNDLARSIQQAVDTEINELAAQLADADDAHIFGDTEFKIRALAHRIAAKAVEQRLAKKKTDTRGPA
jgi:hypothetical protein